MRAHTIQSFDCLPFHRTAFVRTFETEHNKIPTGHRKHRSSSPAKTDLTKDFNVNRLALQFFHGVGVEIGRKTRMAQCRQSLRPSIFCGPTASDELLGVTCKRLRGDPLSV